MGERTYASDDEVDRYGVIGVPQPELDDLARLAAEVCHVPAAAVNLMTASSQATVAGIGVDVAVCDREDAMCAAVMADEHPVLVSDASQDDRWRDNPYVNGERDAFRFYAAHHLVTPRGVTIGTMCVFDRRPRDLDSVPHFQLSQIARRVEDFLELRLRTRELEESVADLAQARADLEQANAILQGFAARVAHDLRGPLSSIGGTLELVSEGFEEDDVDRELLERALGSVTRMDSVITTMLQWGTSPDADRPAQAQGSVDLESVLEQVRVDLASQLRGVDVEVEDLPVVPGDPTAWRVVLQNLLANAAKFNDTDAPRVRVTGRIDEREWVLEVADNGPGVPDGERLRVFEATVRGDRTVDGFGLGLATCWRVVTDHGGVIVMDAAEPRGALVRIRVPVTTTTGALAPDRA